MPPQNPIAPNEPVEPAGSNPPIQETPAAAPQTPQAPFPAPPTPPAPDPSQPMHLNPAYGHDKLAIASLVLGIVSLPASILNILTLPIPVIGIVLGLISLKRNKGLALAGIVLSGVGIVLSIIIFAIGLNIVKDKKSANNSSATSSISGDKLTTTCYEFSLPAPLTKKDVTDTSDCSVFIVNGEGSEDVVVQATTAPSSLSDSDVDEYLKTVSRKTEQVVEDKIQMNSRKFVSMDGARAYQVSGPETYGSYKYGGLITVVAPKEYVSTAGTKLKVFTIAYDSATNQTSLDDIVKSWHWQ